MAMILLAKETAGAILGDAGLTILTGLVVVFAVLLLLIGVFKLFGLIFAGKGGEAQPEAAAPAAPAAPAAAAAAPIVGNTQPVTTQPAVQNGIPEETVAAISAAVAAVAPAGKQYAVSGIRKK